MRGKPNSLSIKDISTEPLGDAFWMAISGCDLYELEKRIARAKIRGEEESQKIRDTLLKLNKTCQLPTGIHFHFLQG